jgi:hypothetical protein
LSWDMLLCKLVWLRRSPSLVWHTDFHLSKFVSKLVFEESRFWPGLIWRCLCNNYRSAFIHPFKNVQCGFFQITENFVHIQTGPLLFDILTFIYLNSSSNLYLNKIQSGFSFMHRSHLICSQLIFPPLVSSFLNVIDVLARSCPYRQTTVWLTLL